MRHRVRALGGTLEFRTESVGDTVLAVRIPNEHALKPVAESEVS